MDRARRSLRDTRRRATIAEYNHVHEPLLLAAEGGYAAAAAAAAAGLPRLGVPAVRRHTIAVADQRSPHAGESLSELLQAPPAGEHLPLHNGGVATPVGTARALDPKCITASFVKVFTGSVLGTGTVLPAAKSERDDGEPPGLFAPLSDARATWAMVAASWINLLLLCIPLGVAAGLRGWNPTFVFTTNFLSLIPLALILGEITEDLAVRFGDTIGGLLNATFGNVVELVVALQALRRGLFTVVATSLMGSILSNLLLVLGMCFWFGGMRFKAQSFNTLANKVSSSLLFLACIATIIPSTARMVYGKQVITQATVLNLSHAIAVLMICMYCCYLFFQLKTHKDYFSGEEDGEDEPVLSMGGALLLLTAITAIVAVNSEYLTGAIEEVSTIWSLNQAFLGLIVLPIAGNACEHITAVYVAVKDKMDLALGVALGSSIQIAVFAVPFTVLVGWAIGQPFTLSFDPFAVLMLTVSVILAYFVSSDGSSNWLLGLQLVGTYVLIALVFLLQQETPAPGGGGAPSAGGEL